MYLRHTHCCDKNLSVRLTTTMTPLQDSTPPTIIHRSGHSRSMVSMVIPYRDHHAIIKAIEKCSLQATFGPEVTSTSDLLPKKPEAPGVKANHDNTINPIKKRLALKRTLSPSAKTHTNKNPLPVNHKNVNVAPNLVTNDGGPLILTTQRGSIHSVQSINGGNMPAVSDFENNSALFMQGSSLRQVPLETWGQKVSSHARTP